MMNASTNATGLAPSVTNLTLISILTYIFLCVVTFGIGSAVVLSDLRDVLRCRKVALAIGLGTQYAVMPAAARLVCWLLRMPDIDAIGLILLGCCPGGATSNAFAYFARADMALSVSMTVVSNALAFATVPLLLYIWTQGLDSTLDAPVPFLDIMGSLLMVLVPAAIGISLRYHRPRLARRAEQLGALSGGVLIATSTFAGLIQNRKALGVEELFPWKNAASVCLVAPVGMLCALGATLALNAPGCRRLLRTQPTPLPVLATVVMETGIQNTVLALAIINLMSASWHADVAFRLQLIPIMWGIVVSTEAVFVMFLFRYLIRRHGDSQPPAPPDDVADAASSCGRGV